MLLTDLMSHDTLSLAESGISYQNNHVHSFEDEDHALAFPHEQAGSIAHDACSYCGVFNPDCMIQCDLCCKWFCNGSAGKSGSHIITHLVMSKHRSVRTHPHSAVGDDTLECYLCGSTNIFVLGYVTAMEANTIVILCRLPCAQRRDYDWDTENWKPLIENRKFVKFLAAEPTDLDRQHSNVKEIKPDDISKLETKWRIDKDATLAEIQLEDEMTVEPIMMRYPNGFEYQSSFAPLVKIEADYDKAMKESSGLEYLSVEWSVGLNGKHLASFALSTIDSGSFKIVLGDEMILRFNDNHFKWEGKGYIIKIPDTRNEYFTLELNPSSTTPPVDIVNRFTGEFIWKGTSFIRMQSALETFALDPDSLSTHLYDKLLGKDVEDIKFDVKLPTQLSIPGQPILNETQKRAVKAALESPLTLIQGPPGTGKTNTSGAIVYHLNKMNPNKKILVCAPSNVATDHLTLKLSQLGLNVVRLMARSREDVDSTVKDYTIDKLIKDKAGSNFLKLFKKKEELGELNHADGKIFEKEYKKYKNKVLKSADIICCTCVGAGDFSLSSFDFHAVLIDESTQASEPESLIPITTGVKQVILVGDHQQLGPVILNSKAAAAGLRQSLFERLIFIGHTPVRLQVQYRMNPCLSEFPSNMFYDGSLQNGITKEDRAIHNTSIQWPMPDTPMMFWSVFGREEISASGTSYLNRIEAMNTEKIVTKLFNDGVQPHQIGIITPYEGQRVYISQYMQLNGSLEKERYRQIEILSIDAFQGREKDYIILSCVRANNNQLIGFLKDPRRLNVALTRAKYGLFILGNPKTLNKNKLWNYLLTFYRERGCLVEGSLDNLQISHIQLSRIQRKYETFDSSTGKKHQYKKTRSNSIVSYNGDHLSNSRFPSLTQAYGLNVSMSDIEDDDNEDARSFLSYTDTINESFAGTHTREHGSEVESVSAVPQGLDIRADLQKLTSTFGEFTF